MLKRPALFCIIAIMGIVSFAFSFHYARFNVETISRSPSVVSIEPVSKDRDPIKNAFNPIVMIHAGAKHCTGFLIEWNGELKAVTAAHCLTRFGMILPRDVNLTGLIEEINQSVPTIRVTIKINDIKYTTMAYPQWIGTDDFTILKFKNPESIKNFYSTRNIEVNVIPSRCCSSILVLET